MSNVNLKKKKFFFLYKSHWKVHTLRDLGFHLILKGDGKTPTKLNMLVIHVNSIKTSGRLPAYMKSIQGWSGTGYGSWFEGRESSAHQVSSRSPAWWGTSSLLLWIYSLRVRSTPGADPLQHYSCFLLLWPCSWASDYAVTQLQHHGRCLLSKRPPYIMAKMAIGPLPKVKFSVFQDKSR